MPSVSKKQRVAMIMAKKGESTLDIPQNVGSKFVAADARKSKTQLANLPLRKGAPAPSPPSRKKD